MEDDSQISAESKLPSKPKRRFVLKQANPLAGKERQTSAIEDNSEMGMGGSKVNQSDSASSKITQPPPATYEDHPSWKSWRGRMSRGEYLMFCFVIYPIITTVLYLVVLGIGLITGGSLGGSVGGAVTVVLWIGLPLYLGCVRICADIKRFHDFGQSGLKYFAFLIGQVVCLCAILALVITLKGNWSLDGVVGIVGGLIQSVPWWLILIGVIFGIINFVVFVCLDGTNGPNKYGPDPKRRSKGGELASLAQTTKQLKELGKMKASGIISESEYEEKRAQILRGA